MTDAQRATWRQPMPLWDYLKKLGWRPARDGGREEVAGLCPLHRETQPSFYVNRRKQLFYCHGCGRGGDVIRLVELLDGVSFGAALDRLRPSPPMEGMLEHTYRFYEAQLAGCPAARRYLAARGIHAAAVIARMRIGYAPGGCLRGHLERLGYGRQALRDAGLVDVRGRDGFFGCLTFPLEESLSLYGRALPDRPGWRHHFLPRAKGGLYGWAQARAFPSILLVEGLFDLAALWQAGFPQTVAALGAHLNAAQFAQLSGNPHRRVYICFDADGNGSGQTAAVHLSGRLRRAGVDAWRIRLPAGFDPADLFAAGASARDFQQWLGRARP